MAAKRRRGTPSSPNQTFLFFADDSPAADSAATNSTASDSIRSETTEAGKAEPTANEVQPVDASPTSTSTETAAKNKPVSRSGKTASRQSQLAPHLKPPTAKTDASIESIDEDAADEDGSAKVRPITSFFESTELSVADDSDNNDREEQRVDNHTSDVIPEPSKTDDSDLTSQSLPLKFETELNQQSESRHVPKPQFVSNRRNKQETDQAESESGSQASPEASVVEPTDSTTDTPKLPPAATPPSPISDSESVKESVKESVSEPVEVSVPPLVDVINQHLAELAGIDDKSDSALETLGKHGRVSQLIPNEVIRASAGTGKTFQLSNRYLKLLALGQDPRHILATTFTKKAAGEILERIIQRLTAAALEETAAEQLSQFIDLPLNRDDCRVLLKRMIRSLNGLQIGTLDSFFGQVARTFCFELELPQSWTIVDEQDEVRMQNRAIGLAMSDTGVLDLLHLLEKGEATRGLGAQMRWAVEEVYPLYNQTDLDAWKIPGAQENLKPPVTDSLKSCLPVTQEIHGDRGRGTLEKLIELADAQRWDDVLKNTFAKNVRAGNPTYSRKQMPPQLIMQIQKLLDAADDLFVSQLQERNTSAYQLMQHFDKHYKSMKTATGDLRFDNVQNRLARWVRSLDDPAKRMVARLDFHIEHLLLDEFQDTVPQQWRILYPIAKSIAAAESEDNPTSIDNGTLFCVGDQKQAIYRWRGGDSRIFATVKEHFESVQERAMNTSYRSSPVVLDSVNQVFKNLHRHPKQTEWAGLVEQWQAMFEDHEASPNNQNLSGYVTLEQTEDDEAPLLEEVARRVAELYKQTDGCTGQPLSIGVLVPKNKDVATVMGYLNRLNVPASEESGNPLSDSAAVQLLISILQLIDHPGDSASWFHFLHSPIAKVLLAGFTEQEIVQAQQAFPVKDQPVWQRLIAWAQKTKSELLIHGLGPTIAAWAKHLSEMGSERDRKRLKQAVAAAHEYESPDPMRTSVLGRFLNQLKQIDRTQARVRVMNVHQSKGLEFDIVVLSSLETGMSSNIAQSLVSFQPELSKDPTIVCRYTGSENWDLLPTQHQLMFKTHRREHFNEKLCQLYVGMTRARRALHMIIAPLKNEPPQSLAGILRTSLTDVEDEAGKVLFESGTANWFEEEIQKRQTAAEQETAAPEASSSDWNWIPLAENNQPTRGLQRVSPSSLEGGATFPLGSLLSSRQRQSAFLKGGIIHGWFELVYWLDDGRPSEAELRKQAAKLDVNPENWEHWIPDFLKMLETDNTRRVLSKEYYRDAAWLNQWQTSPTTEIESLRLIAQNERPFAVLDNGQFLNGFIDRLVTIMDGDQVIGADIVDYKTDHFEDPTDSEAIANRVAHYRPQLEAYKIAVAKLTKLPLSSISARLVMVSIDQIHPV